MKTALLVALLLVTGAAPALAQGDTREQHPQLVLGPDYEQRFDELARWLDAYEAWERWFEVWGNRVARNFADQPLWDRPVRPGPPAWLAAECQDDWVDDGGLIATACYIQRHWDEEPMRILERRRSSLVTSAGRVDDQVVKRSSFLKRIHVTGLWMTARYPAPPAYGIVGMQVGVFETGRFTLPAAGVMVVVVREAGGAYAWKPATTLGIGYRIWDGVPPLMKTPVSVHINVARVQLHGVDGPRFVPGMGNVNLVGLSVSPRRRR